MGTRSTPATGAEPRRLRSADTARARFDVAACLRELERVATRKTREGMTRFAIPNERALGVAMGDIQKLARRVGRDHALALALWQNGVYEARMLAVYVADPAVLTSAQMDAWCRDFDNWAHCDTACFALFDRSPHAWKKIDAWARRRGEFQRRAAYALLASVALHDKLADDGLFFARLPMLEVAARDGRNFVKKAVSWALRGVGKRNAELRTHARALAQRLAESDDAAARWVGKDALRELARAR
jgi:3-methyladenine DNA glycosylase AlkD